MITASIEFALNRQGEGCRIIDYVQVVNAGDSEFKAGEIIEKDRVEELNDET